jgi:hypothetical protein
MSTNAGGVRVFGFEALHEQADIDDLLGVVHGGSQQGGFVQRQRSFARATAGGERRWSYEALVGIARPIHRGPRLLGIRRVVTVHPTCSLSG